MRARRQIAWALVLAVGCLGACFEKPEIPEGLMCSEKGNCPPGQECIGFNPMASETGICSSDPEEGGLLPDAGFGFSVDADIAESVHFGAGTKHPNRGEFTFAIDGYIEVALQP